MRKIKRITLEDFIKVCNSIHNNYYNYSQVKFENSNCKVTIICPEHGAFQQNICDHKSGHGCWKCHSKSTKTWTEEEDSFMRQNYRKISAIKIAQILKKTPSAVWSRGYILGLMKRLAKNDYSIVPAYIWNGICNRVKHKNLEFNIAIRDLEELFTKQNGKCALTGWDIKFSRKNSENTVSVDRIDCKKGYIKGNIQLVNKKVNKIKLDNDEKFFYDVCVAVSKNRIDDYKWTEIEWRDDYFNDTLRPIKISSLNKINRDYSEESLFEKV